MLRLGLLVLGLLASGGATAGEGEAPPVRTLVQGAMSRVKTPGKAVARTPEEALKLWKQHTGGQAPSEKSPLQRVDWSKEMVLAVFMGTRPTGGFGIRIRDAREEKGKLVVTYGERLPGREDIVTQALTSPFHIVAVKRSSLPVEWKQTREAPPGASGRPSR